MQTFNVYDGGDWDTEHDREGYRHKATAFGKRLGAEDVAVPLRAGLRGVAVGPDSGKVGIWTEGNGYESMLRDEPKLDCWEGE